MLFPPVLLDPGMEGSGGGAPGVSGGESLVDLGSGGETEGGGGSAEADDYSDLASDERVGKYIAAQEAKKYGHIPEQYRSQEGFGSLTQAQQQLRQIQGDPRWQQMQQQQRQQQGQPPDPFHKSILAELQAETGITIGKDQVRFFSGMIDRIAKGMEDRISKQHFEPLKQHLQRQYFQQERSDASKLPGFAGNEEAIRQVVAQIGCPWESAYKIVMHDVLAKKAKAAAAAATQDESPTTARTPAAADKHKSDGERPSGATAGSGKLPRFKDKAGARAGAASRLRSLGIRVGD